MATTKKRLILTLPKEVEDALGEVARRDRVPASAKALALLKSSLELDEDRALIALAESRDTPRARFVSQKEIWEKYM